MQADLAEERRQVKAAQKKKEAAREVAERKAAADKPAPAKRNPQLESCLNTAHGLAGAAQKARVDYCNRSFPAKN